MHYSSVFIGESRAIGTEDFDSIIISSSILKSIYLPLERGEGRERERERNNVQEKHQSVAS